MPKLSTIRQCIMHPIEFRSVVAYQLWRDPLNRPEDHPETSGWDREDMKICLKLLHHSSRSFVAVIKELEGELFPAVAIFYLVLRALDTIEDDMTLDLEEKCTLLENFTEKCDTPGWTFNGSGPNEKDRIVLVQFDSISAEFRRLGDNYKSVIRDACTKMGAGMARYCRLHAESSFSVDTLASFDLYCHYVAGVVGEGLSGLFSASHLEWDGLASQKTLSNDMGLFLQKVNVLRDFREDVDEGRVFWPREIWGKYAKTPQELYAPENRSNALWALSEMTVDALKHATFALDYLTLIQNQSAFNFCAIPQVMAIATLDTCFMNHDVFLKNVKIRKTLALSLMIKATNPCDVAYMFRDFARSIHAKATPADPSYVKISILCGRIEQWCESHYPSYVLDAQKGKRMIRYKEDWQAGDDVRILQLPSKLAPYAGHSAGTHDSSSIMNAEDLSMLAAMTAILMVVFLVIGGITFGGVWFFFSRENAPYHDQWKQ